MSERVKCKAKDCSAMILVSTAEKTGGLCMPCKNKAEKIAHEKYIRENKKTIDLYEGITDKTEIIKIMHQPQKYDPLIDYLPYKESVVELYESLNDDEISRLTQYIINNIDTDNFEAIEGIVSELSAFTNIDLTEINNIMIEQQQFYPGYIFRGAKPEVAVKLIDLITQSHETELDLHHLLSALAWVGTDSVIVEFAKWRKDPPKWYNELYRPLEEYSWVAGWELDDENNKRQLTLDKCYSLIKTNNSSELTCVKTCKDSKDLCKWCGRTITILFELDMSDKIWDFIPYNGKKLTIATCEVCSEYSDSLYMTVKEDGGSVWSSYSEAPEYLPDSDEEFERLSEASFNYSLKERLLHHSIDWCLPSTYSQVGGIPSWIQYEDYNKCPKCKNSMLFLAQLSVEDFQEYGEGIFYGLFCPKCLISNVKYQQT